MAIAVVQAVGIGRSCQIADHCCSAVSFPTVSVADAALLLACVVNSAQPPSWRGFDTTSTCASILVCFDSSTRRVQGTLGVEDQAAALLRAVDSLTAAVSSRQGLLEEPATAQQGTVNVPGSRAGRRVWSAAADAFSPIVDRIAGRGRA